MNNKVFGILTRSETMKPKIVLNSNLTIPDYLHNIRISLLDWKIAKGQLNSEWIHGGHPFYQNANLKPKDFCPTKQTRIVAGKTAYLHSPKNHQIKSTTVLVCMLGQKSL